MTFQSSNTEWFEKAPTQSIINSIRIAMGEGCIRPAHLYDLVDEALCRLAKHENCNPKYQDKEDN